MHPQEEQISFSDRYVPHVLEPAATLLAPGYQVLMERIEFPDRTITRYYPQRFIDALYGPINDAVGRVYVGLRRPAGFHYFYDERRQTVHFPTIQEAINYALAHKELS